MDRPESVAKLSDAHALVSQCRGGYSGEFLGAEEFAEALEKAVEEFEKGSNKVSEELRLWFAPTSQWDDFVGREGIEPGNLIHEEFDKHRNTYGIKV